MTEFVDISVISLNVDVYDIFFCYCQYYRSDPVLGRQGVCFVLPLSSCQARFHLSISSKGGGRESDFRAAV